MLLVEKFQDFLHRTGHTRESFARLMGVQPSLLSRLIPKDGIPPVREPRLSTLIKPSKRPAARSRLRISPGPEHSWATIKGAGAARVADSPRSRRTP